MSRLYLPPLALLCNIACMSAPANFANEMPCDVFYEDADGDSFGGLPRTNCEELHETDVMNDDDCDDEDAMTYPGAGWKEEEDSACMRDADKDGYGDDFGGEEPPEGIVVGTDCNDVLASGGAEQYPGRKYYFDCDNDGYFSSFDTLTPDYEACEPPDLSAECGNEAPPGITAADNVVVDPAEDDLTVDDGDCDDHNAAINPAADEICDEIDNDCDDDIDDDDPSITGQTTYYEDDDEDSYGTINVSEKSCNDISGYVTNKLDCDDTDASLNPDTLWYLDDDNDAFGGDYNSKTQCEQPLGSYVRQGNDCDDADNTSYPGATELCDGRYNNCDDRISGSDPAPENELDNDGDGYVTCPSWVGDVTITAGGDCDDSDEDEHPGVTWYADNDKDTYGDLDSPNTCERWENKDSVLDNSDCDDEDEDEHPGVTWYVDDDEDGYGDVDNDGNDCVRLNNTDVADEQTDCDDDDDQIHPAASEVIGNAIDEDCNDKLTCYYDGDQDGDGVATDTEEITKSHCNFSNKFASSNSDDCDDSDPDLNTETMWAVDDDGDGYGNPDATYGSSQCVTPITMGANYSMFDATQPDCDDSDSNINPGATDVIGDDIDQDCDDEYACFQDSDLDGFGDASVCSYSQLGCYEWGYSYNDGDCDDSDPDSFPGAFEIPGDGTSQDCDLFERCFYDGDSDGYGSSEHFIAINDFTDCAAEHYVENYGDCNDSDSSSNPGVDIALDDNCECSLAGDWEASEASDYLLVGEDSSSYGQSMAALGDINGDGSTDFIVGAPSTAIGIGSFPNGGAVYIHTSLKTTSNEAQQSVSFFFTGRKMNEFFGFDVAPAGDWNSDGFADFMVSSKGPVDAPSGETYAGAVFVYPGANSDNDVAASQGDFTLLVTPTKVSTGFGEDLLAAPLRDRYKNDLIISDFDLGYVSILPHDSSLAGEIELPTAETTLIEIEPRNSSSTLGTTKCDHLASIPSRDGTHWLAIGNPYAPSSTDETGEVLIFKDLDSLNSTVSSADADLVLDFPGTDNQGEPPLFGISVLSADVNHDNYPDLIVGAPGEEDDTGAEKDRGAVYIFLFDPTIDSYPALPDITLFGDEYEQLGTEIEVIDINGDGHVELAMASSATDAVYLLPSQSLTEGEFNLASLAGLTRIYSNEGSASFGQKIANAGDLIEDDNNLPELVVAAPYFSFDNTNNDQNQGVIITIPGTDLPMMDYTAIP